MITFTRATNAQDDATGQVTPVNTSITGTAIQVRGNPRRYKELGLVLATMPTLLFTPTTYPLAANGPAFVQPGDKVVWQGRTMTVKDVDPVAPDGFVIVARIVVGT